MVLGEVVCFVGCSRFPEDMELLLADSIFQPVESHVDGLGMFHFDGVIGDSRGSVVVGLDRSGWLWVAHLSKGVANGAGLFRIEEEGTEFGLGGTGHDGANDVAEDIHSAVVRWWRVKVRGRGRGVRAEEQVPASS